tara:strand:+ start:82 stop:582 length:501 start_codon:yes stop_codon:yes gene_type:complete
MLNIDNELDLRWINDFEDLDNRYKMFYKEDVDSIRVNYIYINNCSDITRVTRDFCMLPTKNLLPEKLLLSMIEEHKLNKYKLAYILKYNFAIEPTDVKTMNYNLSNWMTEIPYVTDIRFDNTITMFQDLNELNIFFVEKQKNTHNKTLKRSIIEKVKKNLYTRKFK